MRKSKTTIQVSKETHRRLTQLAKKEESYDQVIQRLLEYWELSGLQGASNIVGRKG